MNAVAHPCSDCGRPVEPFKRLGRPPIYGTRCDPCVEKARVEDRRRREAEAREAKAAADRALFGEDANRTFTFDRFQASDGTRNAVRALQKFDPSKDDLYLFGTPGVGKTHLASAAYRACKSSNRVYGYLTWAGLNRRFRGLNAVDEENALDRTSRCSPLLIDDLAAGRTTDFTADIFLQLLDLRIRRGIGGLLITSNLSISDLAALLQDDRIPSRLAGLCTILEMSGPDYRLNQAKRMR